MVLRLELTLEGSMLATGLVVFLGFQNAVWVSSVYTLYQGRALEFTCAQPPVPLVPSLDLIRLLLV